MTSAQKISCLDETSYAKKRQTDVFSIYNRGVLLGKNISLLQCIVIESMANMQNIERLLGFRIEVDDVLPAQRLESLKTRARQIASRLQLDPEDHSVYVHSLSIIPTPHTFLKRTRLSERVDSVAIGFWVNPKQEISHKIRILNTLFRDVLDPKHQYANYHGVQYTVSGLELENGTFTNEIITFVHKSLPAKHRKLKIAILARPTKLTPLRDSGRVVTKVDLKFNRYTPIALPKVGRKPLDPYPSPSFLWRGPTGVEALHSFLSAEQDWVDVGDATRMIEESGSVCRVEIPEGHTYGTGVLINESMVLTNYHVLEKGLVGKVKITDSANELLLRFGAITNRDGSEASGRKIRLNAQNPIAEASPTGELDFVLLRLADPVTWHPPVKFGTDPLHLRDALHILSFPLLAEKNHPLKAALRPNAVTGVYAKLGRVQYITRATHGSSGAPCFNKNWEMVAIHRAERSVPFGTRREGILFSSIFKRIQHHLEGQHA